MKVLCGIIGYGLDSGPSDLGPLDRGPSDLGPLDVGPIDVGGDQLALGKKSWLPPLSNAAIAVWPSAETSQSRNATAA